MNRNEIDFVRDCKRITETQRLRALSIGKELHYDANATTIKSPVAVTFTDAHGCEITTWHGMDGYEHIVLTTKRRK